MGAAEGMGHGPTRSYSRPLTPRPAPNRSTSYNRVPMSRKPTDGSQHTQYSYNSAYSARPPPGRMNSGSINRGPSRHDADSSTNAPSTEYRSYGPPNRSATQTSIPSSQNYTQTQEYEMRPQPPNATPSHSPSSSQYVAYNPNVHSATASLQGGATTAPAQDYFSHQPHPPPQRSGTAPPPLPQPPRSGTAPPPQASAYDSNMNFGFEGQRNEYPLPPIPSRPATAGPGAWNGQRRPLQRF
ncbi:MAG: hypothetical protein Q9216_002590 [Gyalolechia sp. 2 TL-2023]